MQIDSSLVKALRTERHWSQSQLGDACGLTLRTIQRLESSGRASVESVRALAAVFEINPDDLLLKPTVEQQLTPIDAIRLAFLNFADFSGLATRIEYWWFLGFAVLITSVVAVAADTAYQIVGLLLIVPLISVGSRRLNDAGHSGWCQLLFLVPFGFVVVFILLAQERNPDSETSGTSAPLRH